GLPSVLLHTSDLADTITTASTATLPLPDALPICGLDTFGAIDQTTIGAAGLTVNGGGQGEALTLNGGASAETIGINATQVTRSSGGPASYATLATITVNGTAPADTINVTGTASGI